jgi:hypothetical protein
MNFRKTVFFLAAIAIVSCVSASAQTSVYGMFTADQLSNIKSSPLPLPPNSTAPVFDRSDSVNPLGGGGGVFYNFKTLGPVRLGVDVRGTIASTKRGAYVNFNGPGARLYSVLGGPRFTFHTPIKPLKPYVEGLVGLGRSDYGLYVGLPPSNAPVPTPIYSNFEYQGVAGLDIRLLPSLDFRLVEFGYGGLNPFGTYSHNYPVKQVGTGIVIHLPF